MKKLFFLFVLILYIVSCKGTSQSIINPLATRTVEVENTTPLSINIKVYTVHNSGLSFSGIINPGDKKTFSNVSECNVEPNSAYNWKLERSYDKNGNQTFKLRVLTEEEKLKVKVWNINVDTDVKLKYKVKASTEGFEVTPPIKKGLGVLIRLYDVDYQFELDSPPTLPTKQRYDISYNKAEEKITITQVPTE